MVVVGSSGKRGRVALALAAAWAGTALLGTVAHAADTNAPPATGNRTKFFPIPMYTTSPNEGSTYGLMPVLLRVKPDGEIVSILAPSVSWNREAGVNTTLRYYRFPRRELSWSVVAAASTNVNRTLFLQYDDRPRHPGQITINLFGQARRNIFYRFFGLGPDSPESGESSYTRTTVLGDVRAGINLPWQLNAGLRVIVRGDSPEQNPIFGLPALQTEYPTVPGVNGARSMWAAASLRYDTRENREYSHEGVAVELTADNVIGWKAVNQFGRVTADARMLWAETAWLQGAGRVYWSQTLGGADIPFYYLNSLGGDSLLRGFPEDRFFDRGAWTVEVEQRFRVLKTRMFDVTTDWVISPFVAAGQVFPRHADMFDHVRLSVGAGFRAWVYPNVVGRVDVAYAGEGFRAYVVLGYPY